MKPTDIIGEATEVYNQLALDDPESLRFEEFKDRYYRSRPRRDVEGANQALGEIAMWLSANRHRAGIQQIRDHDHS